MTASERVHQGRTPPNGAVPPEPALSDVVLRRLQTGGSFVLDAPEGVPAVWGRDDQVLWSAGEPLLGCGPAGVGKTTLASQLVRARLGLSDEVLGFPVVPGARKVLYLASDRPRQVQRAMRRLYSEDDREVLDARLVVWPGPPPADVAKVPETLVMLAEAAGTDTVVIDSLKDVAIGLASDEVGAGLNCAMQLVVAEGIELAGLHHQRKGAPGDKPKTLADVYGSTWITAGVGSVLLLWGNPGDPLIELSHLKQPAAEVGPLTIEHDHAAGTTTVYRGFDLLRYLRLHGRGATATEVAVAWFEKARPTDNERKKAERALKALADKGLAHRHEGSARYGDSPEGARYFATESALTVVGEGVS